MDWKTRAMRVWRSVGVNLGTIWSTSEDERMRRDMRRSRDVRMLARAQPQTTGAVLVWTLKVAS